MSEYLLHVHRREAQEILQRHHLQAPPPTVEMLAKEIMRCRRLRPTSDKPKYGLRAARARLSRALRITRKLVRYLDRTPRRTSLSRTRDSLRGALNHPDVAIWLAGAGYDVLQERSLLEAHTLARATLTKLASALESSIDAHGPKVRRPRVPSTAIVMAAYIAWRRSGRDELFTWDPVRDQLCGRLPEFVRDLVKTCGAPVLGDKNLQKKLLECEKDKQLQGWLAKCKTAAIE